MKKVLTAEEMREVDRLTTERYGIPSILLMENAAHAAARAITERLGGSVAGKSFLILCGKGSNGGDGAALGRILWTLGANCFVYLFGKTEDTKGDARVNFEILRKFYESDETNAPNENCLLFFEFENSDDLMQIISENREDAVVDALFGTGLSRPTENDLQKIIERLRRLKKRRKLPFLVSIDVPSGLNADLSEPIGENIQADLTVAFTAPKAANVLPPASNFGGELVVANIGSPPELIDAAPSQLFLAEQKDVKLWLRRTEFESGSHKSARGRALIIAGSKWMSGAAVLCANAAMRSGIGLVRVATSESAQAAVAAHALPEIMVAGLPETKRGAISELALQIVEELSDKMNVVAVGSGLSADEASTGKFVRRLIETRRTPVVIDADGLNLLAPFKLKGSDDLPIVLTPHQGEFLKLLGTEDQDAIRDRVTAARAFAQKHHVVLVFKGERNLIAAPDGKVVVVPTGNSGLGKAGNGDTLAGIVAGFIGQTIDNERFKIDFESNVAKPIDKVFDAVVAAVYIAGAAGDIAAERFGKRAMQASDVRECLAEAFRDLEK